MRHTNEDMLLFCALADACAVGVEYNDREMSRVLEYRRYYPHPLHGEEEGRTGGQYTDDTEMSIANANVLITASDLVSLTRDDFARAYYREFLVGGRRKGYSRGFQQILEETTHEGDLLSKIRPDSRKNGAAMRAAPIGVIPDVHDVIRVAVTQARVTHDTPEGRMSAVAIAIISHFALYTDDSFADIIQHTGQVIGMAPGLLGDPGFMSKPWDESKRVVGNKKFPVSLATVQAVAHFLRTETGLMDTLTRVIRTGGDTDSVAAITWSILSTRASEEEKKSLPEFMLRDLEPGSPRTGVQRLRLIGSMLMNRFK